MESKDHNGLRSKVEFIIEFEEGKLFRDLIDAIKQINDRGWFKFNKSGFGYSQYSEENKIWIDITIDGTGLKYEFKCNDSDYAVELEIKSIKNNLSQVSAKDGIKIYKLLNEQNIYFQRTSKLVNVSKSVCCMAIPNVVKEHQEYNPPEYAEGEDKPTITVGSIEFKKELSSIIKTGSQINEIHITKNSVTFAGANQEKTSTAVAQFDANPGIKISGLERYSPVISKKEFNISIEVSKKVLKYFSKISTLTKSNGIKLFVQENLPLKIVSNFGTHGTIKSYIDIGQN